MKAGTDLSAAFPGVFLIHQKIRGSRFDEHEHAEHEIFLPLQGEIRIRAGEQLLRAGPGRMIYLPPGAKHEFESSAKAEGERLIVLIEGKTWDRFEGAKLAPGAGPASQLAKELLFHLLLHPKSKAVGALVETLVRTLSETLTEAVGEISDHLGGKASDPRVRRALAEIERSYREKFSMASLARKSGMSVRSLNRLFLEELGVTPGQVLVRRRVEEAKRRLRARGVSVTDVADEVGYQSLSQFIEVFRRVTGSLPSEWKG